MLQGRYGVLEYVQDQATRDLLGILTCCNVVNFYNDSLLQGEIVDISTTNDDRTTHEVSKYTAYH